MTEAEWSSLHKPMSKDVEQRTGISQVRRVERGGKTQYQIFERRGKTRRWAAADRAPFETLISARINADAWRVLSNPDMTVTHE